MLVSHRPRLNFAGLLAAAMISGLGFGLVIPLLPSYGRAYDANAFEIGALFSCFSVGQALGEGVWGRLSDRIGRKPVILATLTLSIAGYIAMAAAPTFAFCLIARLLCGVAAGNTGAVQALLIDTTPPERLTARLSIFGACSSLGLILGPAAGGLLAGSSGDRASFATVFLLTAGLSALGALSVLLLVQRPDHASRRRGRTARRLRYTPAAVRLIAVNVVMMGAFAGVESVFGLWTEYRFDWSARELGLAFACAGAVGTIMQLLVTSRLVRRFGERPVLAAGLGCTAAALCLQPFSPVGWGLVLLICAVSVGFSLSLPTTSALLSREAPKGQEGELMGASMSAAAAARIGGPLFTGLIFSAVAPQAPFVICGAIVGSALLLACRPAAKGDPR